MLTTQIAHYSVSHVQCSVLHVHCSLLTAHCSVFTTKSPTHLTLTTTLYIQRHCLLDDPLLGFVSRLVKLGLGGWGGAAEGEGQSFIDGPGAQFTRTAQTHSEWYKLHGKLLSLPKLERERGEKNQSESQNGPSDLWVSYFCIFLFFLSYQC